MLLATGNVDLKKTLNWVTQLVRASSGYTEVAVGSTNECTEGLRQQNPCSSCPLSLKQNKTKQKLIYCSNK